MSEEFEAPDIVSVIDEDGIEHYFEELSRIETDNGKYVALLSYYSDDGEILDDESDDDEVVILKVIEENGEVYLEALSNQKEYDEVAEEFRIILSEDFDIEETE